MVMAMQTMKRAEGREEQGGRTSVQQEGLWDGGVEAKTEDEKAPTWQNSFQVEETVGIALFWFSSSLQVQLPTALCT